MHSVLKVLGPTRAVSLTLRALSAQTKPDNVEKSVFISQSEDVFTNLALEDWFYRNSDFATHRLLLLWKNRKAVVIGRHQNLWAEVELGLAQEQGVSVARRNSGGGSVYHDTGNLNCTFFMPRPDYNRRANLEVIQRALRRDGMGVEINCKDDLTLNGAKISGTASKLGKNAYHHCTLLVDSDLSTLTALLNPNTDGLESRATKSIRSKVDNLKAANPSATVEKVLSAIGYEYLRTDGDGKDGGEALISQQRGFTYVNPTEAWFPGLDSIRAEFRSWAWTAARTPEFTVRRTYGTAKLELKVVKGLIQAVESVQLPPGREVELSAFLAACEGQPFRMDVLEAFEALLRGQKSVGRQSSSATFSSDRDSKVFANDSSEAQIFIDQSRKTMFAV